MADLVLCIGSEWRTNFWSDVQEQYVRQEHCDLNLRCGGGTVKDGSVTGTVACHKLVVASASRLVAGLLRDTAPSHDIEEGGVVTLHFPDVKLSLVKAFVDCVYGFLAGGKGQEKLAFPAEMGRLFDISCGYGAQLVKAAGEGSNVEVHKGKASSVLATEGTSSPGTSGKSSIVPMASFKSEDQIGREGTTHRHIYYQAGKQGRFVQVKKPAAKKVVQKKKAPSLKRPKKLKSTTKLVRPPARKKQRVELSGPMQTKHLEAILKTCGHEIDTIRETMVQVDRKPTDRAINESEHLKQQFQSSCDSWKKRALPKSLESQMLNCKGDLKVQLQEAELDYGKNLQDSEMSRVCFMLLAGVKIVSSDKREDHSLPSQSDVIMSELEAHNVLSDAVQNKEPVTSEAATACASSTGSPPSSLTLFDKEQVAAGEHVPEKDDVGKGVTTHVLRALPLAWRCTHRDFDPGSQFMKTGKALKAVFGFSEKDIYFHHLIVTRQNNSIGGSREARQSAAANNFHYVAKRKFAAYTHDKLKAKLNEPEVKAVTQRTDRKKQLKLASGRARLDLDNTLDFNDLDGILVVRLFPDGSMPAHILKVDERDMDQEAANVNRAILAVWAFRMQPKTWRVPSSPSMLEKFSQVYKASYTYEVCCQYVSDPEAGKSILETRKKCKYCQQDLPFGTVNQIERFISHENEHYYKEHQCNCDFTDIISYAEKVDHVKLQHSEGAFVRCDKCSSVIAKKMINNHVCYRDKSGQLKKGTSQSMQVKEARSSHAQGTKFCTLCNREFATSLKHAVHKYNVHTERKCKHCDQIFPGALKLIRHLRKSHRNLVYLHHDRKVMCDICGRTFKGAPNLVRHRIATHQAEAEKPHQCDACPRGFATPSDLKNHAIMAHIRDRRFACRYGCGARYNDTGSRSGHEKSKHGGVFSGISRKRGVGELERRKT